MTTHVIYHGNCYDGFGAAWAAWMALGDDATYIPANHGDSPPDLPEDADVVIVDFSYKRAVLEELSSRVRSLVILDHHKTAEDDLKGFPNTVFDMDHSGAYLSCVYFHPDDEVVPEFINYIEDRDLFRFDLDHSREISAAISSHPFDFVSWSNLFIRSIDKTGSRGFNSLVSEGESILRHQRQMVNRICEHYVIRNIGGYDVPVVNASLYFGEVAMALVEKHPDYPFAAYYFNRGDGKRQWGMRSKGSFDVSKVATSLGGGGHPNAAGFQEIID